VARAADPHRVNFQVFVSDLPATFPLQHIRPLGVIHIAHGGALYLALCTPKISQIMDAGSSGSAVEKLDEHRRCEGPVTGRADAGEDQGFPRRLAASAIAPVTYTRKGNPASIARAGHAELRSGLAVDSRGVGPEHLRRNRAATRSTATSAPRCHQVFNEDLMKRPHHHDRARRIPVAAPRKRAAEWIKAN